MGTPESNGDGKATRIEQLSGEMFATYSTRRGKSYLTITYSPCPWIKVEEEVPPLGFYIPTQKFASLMKAVLRKRDEHIAALGITFEVQHDQEGSCVEVRSSSYPELREVEQVRSGVADFMQYPIVHKLMDCMLTRVYEAAQSKPESNGNAVTYAPELLLGSST